MDVNQKIVDMYNDKTYQELKDYYGKTTIFNVLGIERNEKRHSAFLRWLFDNRSSHGLRDEPMKKLLRLYALHMPKNEYPDLNIMLMAGNYELEISEIVTEKPVKKSKGDDGRIDIWARLTISDKEEDNIVSLVLIIENKIYSNEGDNQTQEYHNYFVKTNGVDDIPIEVFLTPKGAKAPDCNSFKHITYPELLKDVILPLSNMAMPKDASQIITDYVRNLSKPSNEGGKGYSVIATSDEEAKKLKDIYKEFHDLYYAALIAGNMEQIIKTIGNKENIELVANFLKDQQLISLPISSHKIRKDEYASLIQGMENRQLLEAFWNSNEDLFRAILPQIEKILLPIDLGQIFKESHRDTSRYSVYANGKTYGNRLFKNRAANAIFRAYIDCHPGLELEELKNVFPGDLNLYYHDRFYQHLFYEASTIDPPFDAPKFIGKHVVGDINWDFLYEEKYLLPITNGSMKVMSVKMWRKDDFDRLLERVRTTEKLQFIKVERS
jgi:hypothetical protein